MRNGCEPMSNESNSDYVARLGARILSEANDLKRTIFSVSEELNIDIQVIESVISGQADLATAQQLIYAFVNHYPVSLSDIWIDPDDTVSGVLIIRSDFSERSARIFNRPDKNGISGPYYEYKDTAMSRLAPFRPEWIKMLRVVNDPNPDNSDVVFNHGHLMFQSAFFIGSVNFYWIHNGKKHSVELNTGDTCFIMPYIPHSFASREKSDLGVQIAVTFGGEVRQAFSGFSQLTNSDLGYLVSDPRKPESALVNLIERLANAEMLTRNQLISRLVSIGISSTRAHNIVMEGDATGEERQALSTILNCRNENMIIDPLSPEDEVIVKKHPRKRRFFPGDNNPALEVIELVRSPHQPQHKTFDLRLLSGQQTEIQHSLHEYLYNYGEYPFKLIWGNQLEEILYPGDSVYIRPMVLHKFVSVLSHDAQFIMYRIPSKLSESTLREFSTFSPDGRDRVIRETKQWF